ncbi:MAG TPA: HAD domain-containing protein [Methylotenera sp.]|nr:HAD domain-containing protein [Methylotenera sp.]HPH06393.1 HAD domain-containing protein [Methylotenera sp.]HPN01831.1 HAD domain-containing protein [Methylotenera sp.]
MIIYLDFDGVLHPDAVFNPPNRPLVLRAEGELFMHAQILDDALAPYSQAKIVLSTSWVRVLGYDRTLSKMPLKLKERVIGATWHSQMNHQMYQNSYGGNMNRFEQIECHASRTGFKKWLAIDDLFSGYEVDEWPESHRHHLILTDQEKGLSCKNIQAELKEKLLELHRECLIC